MQKKCGQWTNPENKLFCKGMVSTKKTVKFFESHRKLLFNYHKQNPCVAKSLSQSNMPKRCQFQNGSWMQPPSRLEIQNLSMIQALWATVPYSEEECCNLSLQMTVCCHWKEISPPNIPVLSWRQKLRLWYSKCHIVKIVFILCQRHLHMVLFWLQQKASILHQMAWFVLLKCLQERAILKRWKRMRKKGCQGSELLGQDLNVILKLFKEQNPTQWRVDERRIHYKNIRQWEDFSFSSAGTIMEDME